MATDVEFKAFQERLADLERQIGELSGSGGDLATFYRVFLERIVAVLGVGGAIWSSGQDGQMVCCCHMNLAAAQVEPQGAQRQLLDSALSKVLETAGPVVLPARDSANVFDGGLGQAGVNQADHTLLFVPISAGGSGVAAILLLISPSDVDPRAVRGYAGFVAGLCAKAEAFLQRAKIAELNAQLGRSERLRQYTSALHSSLDPRRSCYALANYAQELLGVYRCMAGTFSSRGKFRLESVSGLESVAVKSSFMRSIGQIAREVCRNGKPLVVDNPNAANSETDSSDELVTAARLYMLQAESLVLGVFPVQQNKRVVGALVVEKATENEGQAIDALQRRQIEALLAEAGSGLGNSLAHRNLPLSPLVRAVAVARDWLYRMPWRHRLAWLGVLAMVILLPALITKQVKVVGTAELVPVDSRFVYAGQEQAIMYVAELPADATVAKDYVLARLDTKLIDQQIERVSNQIDAANIELRAVRDSRPTRAAVLESTRKALEAEKAQYELERSQKYELKAPVSGKVITPESAIRQLWSRPVHRGEQVFEIVPTDTPWELTVSVPEDEAGPLLKAYAKLKRSGGDPLKARIILNAFPSLKLASEVISVAPAAHVQMSGQQKYRNVVEVRVSLPADLIENDSHTRIDPRQGMEGKVAIECGKRSLFYVLTHELADFVRVSLF